MWVCGGGEGGRGEPCVRTMSTVSSTTGDSRVQTAKILLGKGAFCILLQGWQHGHHFRLLGCSHVFCDVSVCLWRALFLKCSTAAAPQVHISKKSSSLARRGPLSCSLSV